MIVDIYLGHTIILLRKIMLEMSSYLASVVQDK